MDLEQFKEALGDEKFAELSTYVSDLEGQRDSARNESISKRKGLQSKVSELETQHAEMLEKLGVDSFDELDGLDIKGAAEASKQYEAKLKRLERQLGEATEKAEKADGLYRSSQKSAALAEAMGGHKFLAQSVVASHISNSLVWEGDELFYKTDEGSLVSVKDGVAGFAKANPELLQPIGTGGAGVKPSNTRGGGEAKTMTRADFDAADPKARMEHVKAGGQIVEAA